MDELKLTSELDYTYGDTSKAVVSDVIKLQILQDIKSNFCSSKQITVLLSIVRGTVSFCDNAEKDI